MITGLAAPRRLYVAGADDHAVHHAARRTRRCCPGTSLRPRDHLGRLSAGEGPHPGAHRVLGRARRRPPHRPRGGQGEVPAARRARDDPALRPLRERRSGSRDARDRGVAGRLRPDVRAPAADGPDRPRPGLDVERLPRRHRQRGPRGGPRPRRPPRRHDRHRHRRSRRARLEPRHDPGRGHAHPVGRGRTPHPGARAHPEHRHHRHRGHRGLGAGVEPLGGSDGAPGAGSLRRRQRDRGHRLSAPRPFASLRASRPPPLPARAGA